MIDVNISELVGKTIKSLKGGEGSETLEFKTEDGQEFRMYHSQSCCEHVKVEEIHGDLEDLIGAPILSAEESSNNDWPEDAREKREDHYRDSFTWTFYKIATIKGSVTIRWLGESNGYYGESVDFARVS